MILIRMDESDLIRDQPSCVTRCCRALCMRYQLLLDSFTPFPAVRWLVTVLLGLGYMSRIVYVQGFFIITYALGIYHLNLLIAFLSPKIDPAFDFDSEDYEEDGPSLPTSTNEEFRPFMRRLPEFKFWYSATKAIVIAFILTFFEVFNVPVFWPILVMYFIILFCLTMKRQIKHMIRYRYIPFTFGKPKHRGKPDSVSPSVAASPGVVQSM